jgi:F-type H+-transporting ATPase subunit a
MIDSLTFLASGNPVEHVQGIKLGWHIGPFEMTNQMVMAAVAGVMMIFLLPVLFPKANSDAPKGRLRNFFEAIYEWLRNEAFRPALKQHTDRFTPFLWTLFTFILFCNLLGQIPFAEIATLFNTHAVHAVPIGGTATGTLASTGALAVLTFLFIHFNGVLQVIRSLVDGTYGHHDHGHEDHGDEHEHKHGKPLSVAILMSVPLYIWNFAPHPFKPGPGESKSKWAMDVPLWGLLVSLEMLGALIKPFALMMRLFANMIAGHIVLAALVMLILIPSNLIAQIGIGVPVTGLSLLIRVLELFVAFLQAYIFTFLATLFIASSVAPEH